MAAAVLAVGTIACSSSDNSGTPAGPRANHDHWHAAYAISICGIEQPFLTDVQPDTLGIHTHGDGIIHVHPFVDTVAGDGANLGAFLQQVGAVLADSKLSLPDGTTLEEGHDSCGDQRGQLVVAAWHDASAADDGKAPDEIRTKNLTDLRLRDGEAITIAFQPSGGAIPGPSDAAARVQLVTDVLPSTASS
ncbi:MAG TPA: hypothetical protein VGJ03_11995 [Acidimicrobiales bacterium]